MHVSFSRNGLRLVQAFLFGGLTVAAFCVVADSLYYGSLKLTAGSVHMDTLHKLLDFILHPSQWTQLAYEGTLSWTPLNNLLYNLKTENLAQHGIHPRYVHLLVNLPMLFGPLAFVFAAKFISMIKGAKNDAQAPIIYVLLGIVGISMAGLSLMPHQEARFLAPMLVPLVLLVAWHQRRLPVAFWLLWVVFNIATLYIFGVLHQGGIVPAMAYLQGQVTKVGNCHLLDSSHLTCQLGLSTRTHAMQVQLVDCLGNETCAAETLRQRSGVKLRTDRQFYEIDFAQSTISDAYERTLLIAPNIEPPPQVDGHRYLLLGNYVPHVDFENISIRLVKEGRWKMKLVTPPPSLNVYLLISEE
ncbi:Alg9-like mannosyltransferase family-domain-containing protein [Radiomyces spectabilis]|uniref:Alg9-like mannosyltransferase family-domain-containing protein n=1 Tax=Radiomyces spectabilis TaxID=64574 RepID=UPI002220EE32|nr:Alg9-like mannosyltransferase family-domain-containing protein [Radiomyces spectabilis]KAI8374421.1 Alg9-like mannosyltransferase family-domain-containing protein [Radiomyces spectabilis]